MKFAKICAYRLESSSTKIEESQQPGGISLWAVRNGGSCLNKNGVWECEPMPSNRDYEFLSRCRFATPEEAYSTWEGR